MRDMSEAEFDAALAQYGDTVYRLAFAYTRNRADADDVFQEVFLRYFRRAPAFETEEHRKAWLLRVTINRAKSCLSRRVLHGPPQAGGAVPFSAPASMELHEALSKLAPKYRTVIHLFYYEGYSTAQIAQILDQKESTVRSRLKRGREKLKPLLEEVGALG